MHFISRNKYSFLIFLFGMVYTIWLQTFVKDEVFYSGDDGLKMLLTRQFSQGEYHVDLRLHTSPWVQQLWNKGFYPFQMPFVYMENNRRYITFDFVFALLSSPFYKWFGFRGLRIIPLISTWLIWLLYCLFFRESELDDGMRALTLAILIFASNLTIYSAIFWEHTFGVFLMFCGLFLLLRVSSLGKATLMCALSGLCIGFSIWFRPEFYCFTGALILANCLFKPISWNRTQKQIFYMCLSCTVLALCTINYLVYGHPLGFHSLQIIEHFSFSKRFYYNVRTFSRQSFLLVGYFPFFLLYLFSFLPSKNRTSKQAKEAQYFLVIILLFIISTPFILPGAGGKQFGPRYWLIIIPIVCLQVPNLLKRIFSFSGGWRMSAAAVFSICIAWGVYVNTYRSSKMLENDYNNRVLPALQFLYNDNREIVVVSDQYIAQELEKAFQFKTFFHAGNYNDFNRLIPALLREGYTGFIYFKACMSESSKKRFENWVVTRNVGMNAVIFKSLGAKGEYCAFGAEIQAGNLPNPPQ